MQVSIHFLVSAPNISTIAEETGLGLDHMFPAACINGVSSVLLFFNLVFCQATGKGRQHNGGFQICKNYEQFFFVQKFH